MNRTLLTVFGTALLIAPCHAQAQSAQTPTSNDLSASEFRQVLVDLGSYLDAHRGTDFRRQFEGAPDDVLRGVYSALANPRQFQSAVAGLKQNDERLRAQPQLMTGAGATIGAVLPQAVSPACPPNSIIDDSPGSLCKPSYPDPNNTAWQSLVNPLLTLAPGAFSPTDYTSVSSQGCSLTVESNLSIVTSTLQGTVLAASALCSALPPIASNVCWGVNAAFSIASAVSFGLFQDCVEQDGNVNSAKNDGSFHNTVTIYNALKSANTDIDTRISNVSTQLTNVNTQITGEFSALDTHVTNVDNHVATEFGVLDAHLVTLVNQLTNQISQGTALLGADLKQVMKLELTPNGQKQINPAILTCTGTNCPNVLANCPAAGCSWNDVGPLP